MTMFFYYLTMITFGVVSCLMMMLILIQKGRGGGLASAFGGVGGHSAFGSKTGDVLTWATAIVFGVFLLLAILTNVSFNHVSAASGPLTSPIVTPKSGPVAPGSPASNLPSAPVTADPGVSNPPPAAPVDAPHAPQDSSVTAPGPTTKP